jgi:hypothetical protein
MNKEEILQGVTLLAREKQTSRDEVMQAYDKGVAHEDISPVSPSSFDMADIMYYLGGGIVAIGIGIFLSQNWDVLNTFTRILSTLGSGVLAYNIGVVLSKQATRQTVGQAFHLIAAIVLPIGLFVTLDEMNVDISGFGVMSMIYIALFGLYFISYTLFVKNLFAFVSIVFGTGLFWSLTSWLVSGTAVFSEGDFASYQFLIIGLVYLLLGYSFVKKTTSSLTKYLYPFGLTFFFGATLALGGYAPDQNYFWELIFPGLALGSVFASLPLRSRAFLIIGSIALVGYIFKITGEYFADSFGWPFALILAGFAMIAVGSLFVRLNRKYKTLK